MELPVQQRSLCHLSFFSWHLFDRQSLSLFPKRLKGPVSRRPTSAQPTNIPTLQHSIAPPLKAPQSKPLKPLKKN